MRQPLKHPFQNDLAKVSGREKENFEDDVIGICAGLWNLVLSY
jgi:hypothetical protein